MQAARALDGTVSPARANRLATSLLAWFDEHRRDLPWRRTKDPYAVWLSEIMLQQTRVETVIPYFERFLAELPTVTSLAEAPSERVMSLWSGLGYYRRARMLHEAAQEIARTRAGVFPGTAAALAEVRGIGRYTAGAIASIAFGERTPLVDGNVARVLARLFAIEDDVRSSVGEKKMWALAGQLVPPARSGDWNEALMELGATTCTPRAPRCPVCPLRTVCRARATGTEGTLPVLPRRKEPVAARQVALVASVKGEIVLVRRRPDGLFGGLWEPPTLTVDGNDEEVRAGFASLLHVRIRTVTPRGEVSHTLSHRRLETRVLVATLARTASPSLGSDATYDAMSLVAPATFPQLGMSTHAKKLLARAGIAPTDARVHG